MAWRPRITHKVKMMSYKKRGGLRFLTIGRLAITWSVRKRRVEFN